MRACVMTGRMPWKSWNGRRVKWLVCVCVFVFMCVCLCVCVCVCVCVYGWVGEWLGGCVCVCVGWGVLGVCVCVWGGGCGVCVCVGRGCGVCVCVCVGGGGGVRLQYQVVRLLSWKVLSRKAPKSINGVRVLPVYPVTLTEKWLIKSWCYKKLHRKDQQEYCNFYKLCPRANKNVNKNKWKTKAGRLQIWLEV